MRSETKRQAASASKFAVTVGGVFLALAACLSVHVSLRLRLASVGLMLLGLGGMKLSDRDVERYEKAGSIRNVLKLLSWVLFTVGVIGVLTVGYLFLFHREH